MVNALVPVFACAGVTTPPDPDAAARARLTLFDLHVAQGRFSTAIDDCQEIVECPAWRDQPADELTPYRTAGETCYERIGRLIDAHGREVYAAHERRAEEAIAVATVTRNPETLREAALSFPNSVAARRAWGALGGLRLQSRQVGPGARAYYQAWSLATGNDPPPASSAPVLGLVRAYFDACRWDLVDAWLDAGRRTLPEARFGGQGTLFGWSDLPACLSATGCGVADARPRLDRPLANEADAILDGEVLLAPTMATPSTALAEHIFTYAAAGVMAYRVDTWTPIWMQRIACGAQPRLLYATTERVIFATPYRVWACATATGQCLWSIGEHPGQVDDPNTDPEDFPRYRQFAGDGETLVMFRDDHSLQWVSASSGRIEWIAKDVALPAGDALVRGSEVVYPTHQADRSCWIARALGSQRPERRFAIDSDAQIARMWFNNDDRILILAGGTLAACEADTGVVAWRYGDTTPLSADTVLLAFDGIYISSDGRSLTKLRWSDGWRLWRSPADRPTLAAGTRIIQNRDSVLLLQRDGAAVFDAATGQRRHTWFAPPDVVLDHWFPLADGAIGFALDPVQDVATAYRLAESFDRWTVNMQSVGAVKNVRAVQVCNGVIVLQCAGQIVRWPTVAAAVHDLPVRAGAQAPETR